MGKNQLLTIGLRDGSSVSCLKTYNYFEYGAMIERLEKAGDNDVVKFINDLGEELLIPKRNILFIKVTFVDCEEDEMEVQIWKKLT